TMSSVATTFFEAAPFLIAAALGMAIPSGRSLAERFVVGLVAGLCVMFLQTMWPGAEATTEASEEWPHLLTLIVFLPMLGAVAILFMPRQAPGVLKKLTLFIMGLDFLASLFLLSTTMTKGWHYQYIGEWIPSLGIRYHVALDGLSLWMVLLSTFTMPIAAIVSFGSIQKRIKDLCIALLMLHGAMIGC